MHICDISAFNCRGSASERCVGFEAASSNHPFHVQQLRINI